MGCHPPKNATSAQVPKMVKVCADVLAQIGVTYCHGCGAYGCAYDAGHGLVAKILDTTAESNVDEVNAAALLTRMQRGLGVSRHLPRFSNIYELPARCLEPHKRFGHEDFSAFVIVREDIVDLVASVDDLNVLDDLFDKIENAFAYSGDGDREVQDALNLAIQLLEHKKSEGEIEDIAYVERCFDAAVALQKWGRRNGIWFGDTHTGNWGMRPADGTIVLRDLGAASSSRDSTRLPAPKAGDVRALAGWAGRQRQRGHRLVFRGLAKRRR